MKHFDPLPAKQDFAVPLFNPSLQRTCFLLPSADVINIEFPDTRKRALRAGAALAAGLSNSGGAAKCARDEKLGRR